MYCSKCGNQIPEGASFCAACGEQASQATVNASGVNTEGSSAAGINTGGGSTEGSSNRGSKKSSKAVIIVVAAVAFIILTGVLAYANMWRFMSAKSYYGYLESKNPTFSLNKLYNDLIKATEAQPFSKEIKFTIGEIDGVGHIPDSLDLEDISLTAMIDNGKNASTGYLSVSYDDSVLLDALIYKDKDTIGFGLPLLYGKNFSIKTDEIREVISNLSGEEVPDMSGIGEKSLEELKKELDADTKYIDKQVEKYGKLAWKSISSDSFTLTDDNTAIIYTWKSGGKKRAMEMGECRIVELELTEKDMYNIADNVLEALLKDDKMLEFIYKYQNDIELIGGYVNGYGYRYGMADDEDKVDMKKAIEEMKSMLEEAREDLEYDFDPESDKVVMKMKVIADSDNNIITRELTVDDGSAVLATYTDKNDNKITEINFVEDKSYSREPVTFHMYDGAKGKGIIVLGDGDKLEVSYAGSGEEKSGIGLNYGSYRLRVDSYDSVEVVLTVDKDDKTKNADKLKLNIYQDGSRMLALNAAVTDLKDKKKLNFNKKNAIDLADVDEDELEEIVYEIEDSLQEIIEEITYMMY
ncbi:MAG: zinc ribbon domain-containing protein [Clostridiaceae bacterium]|jgi:hypothetical protein|nr:zinc ribbon domain-containing protein [Clostridiaceae bacterium]